MSLIGDEGWQQFLTLCMKCKNVDQLNEVFQLFFTIEEKETLATRLLLVKELLRGEITQREIASKLNISIAKITRGSNALKRADSLLIEYLVNTLLQ